MLNFNGPGFAGLYAGDSVEFVAPIPKTSRGVCHVAWATRRARVLPLLVFDDHVVVAYGNNGLAVSASNFVRLVRRGKRHMAARRAQLAGWGLCDHGNKLDTCTACALHAAGAS